MSARKPSHPDEIMDRLEALHRPLSLIGELAGLCPKDEAARRRWEEATFLPNWGGALAEWEFVLADARREINEWLQQERAEKPARPDPCLRPEIAHGHRAARDARLHEAGATDAELMAAIRDAVRPVATLVEAAGVPADPEFLDRCGDVAIAAARAVATLAEQHAARSGAFPGELEMELYRAEGVLCAIHAMSVAIIEDVYGPITPLHPAFLGPPMQNRLSWEGVVTLADDAWQRWRPKADAPDPETDAGE